MRVFRLFVPGTLAVMVLLAPQPVQAQEWFTGATYDVSIPAGDLKEFIEDPSWLGVSLNFRKQVSRSMTAGLVRVAGVQRTNGQNHPAGTRCCIRNPGPVGQFLPHHA